MNNYNTLKLHTITVQADRDAIYEDLLPRIIVEMIEDCELELTYLEDAKKHIPSYGSGLVDHAKYDEWIAESEEVIHALKIVKKYCTVGE